MPPFLYDLGMRCLKAEQSTADAAASTGHLASIRVQGWQRWHQKLFLS